MQVRPWGLLLLLNCLFPGINQEITVTITTVMCPRQGWTLNLPLELEKWTWHWKNIQFSFIDIASKIIRWLWSSKIALHIFYCFGGCVCVIILHKFPDAASRLIILFETPLVVGWQVVQGLAMASFPKKAVSQICQIFLGFLFLLPIHYITPQYVTIPSRSGPCIPFSPTHVKQPPAALPKIQQHAVKIILNTKELREKSLPRPFQMRKKKKRDKNEEEGFG